VDHFSVFLQQKRSYETKYSISIEIRYWRKALGNTHQDKCVRNGSLLDVSVQLSYVATLSVCVVRILDAVSV